MKSIKKGAGDVDIPVTFGGVTFQPGRLALRRRRWRDRSQPLL